MMSLKASTLHVVEMPAPNIPTAIMWKGPAEELLARAQDKRKQKPQGPRKRQKTKTTTLRDTAENILVPIQDFDPVAASDRDGVEEIFAGLDIEGFNSDSDDSNGPAQNALEDLCDLAEDVADLFDQPKPDLDSQPQPAKSKLKPKPKPEPAPSSSSRPPGSPEPSMPSKIEPKPNKDDARTSLPPVIRKKEVVEEVLVVPGYGKIYYNSKTKVLTAHCECSNHGSHVCRRQRTSQAPARLTLRNSGQGRPLGLLTAWLLAQNTYEDQGSHVGAASHVFSFHDRCEARAHLKNIRGSEHFLALEREKGKGEESEPECVS